MKFNIPIIIRTVSFVIFIQGLFMLLPITSSLYWNETGTAASFGITSLFCILIGLPTFWKTKKLNFKVSTREGFIVALIAWGSVIVLGAIPVYFSGLGISFVDAFFESAAGWTTTGGYVVDVNTLPNSIVLWKSLCHFMGGMGILFLALSLLPQVGVNGQKLAKSELSGSIIQKTATRISDSAKNFYKLYAVFTVILFVLLKLGGLSTFDSVTNSLNIISSAGLTLNSNGILTNMTPYLEVVVTLFSIVASTNFALFIILLKGDLRGFFQNYEIKVFLSVLGIATALVAINLYVSGTYTDVFSALRNAVLQVVSYGSTSGYAFTDYTVWPSFSKIILMFLIIIGGCSSSTAGSIKAIRFGIGLKLVFRGIYKKIHPRAIRPIMIGQEAVSVQHTANVATFILLYFMFFVFGVVMLSLDNLDVETTFSAAISALSNNGTGFGLIGSTGDFSVFSWWGKLVSAFLMVAGRLEIYPFVVIISRSYWNPDRISK